MDSVLTLYSKPGVLKKSPWHNYLDATLVPPSSLASGEMLKVGKLPWASRAKPGWEHYTRETASKDKGGCGVHSALGLSSPPLSSALTPQGPGGLAFMSRPRGSPCRQQSKICPGKGNPVLPPLPSLGQRSRGLCCRLGVCALVARPSPSPTSVPTPFQTGDHGQALPSSNPFLLASHTPSH